MARARLRGWTQRVGVAHAAPTMLRRRRGRGRGARWPLAASDAATSPTDSALLRRRGRFAPLAGRHDQPRHVRAARGDRLGVRATLDACAAAGSPAQVVRSAPASTRWWALRRWVASHGCGSKSTRRRSFAGRRWRLAATRRCTARCRKVRPPRRSSAAPSRRAGYQLRAADLRDVSALEAALADAGWRPAEPTLVLAECVLVYLPPEAAAAVVALFGGAPGGGALAVYEQIGPDDPFGRTMVDNLRRRNCALLGLAACPSCAAQEARARAAGYSRAEAVPVLEYYEAAVSADERRRVERSSCSTSSRSGGCSFRTTRWRSPCATDAVAPTRRSARSRSARRSRACSRRPPRTLYLASMGIRTSKCRSYRIPWLWHLRTPNAVFSRLGSAWGPRAR